MPLIIGDVVGVVAATVVAETKRAQASKVCLMIIMIFLNNAMHTSQYEMVTYNKVSNVVFVEKILTPLAVLARAHDNNEESDTKHL